MNKTVIVTGASSGIGMACALHYLNNGWNVALAARTEKNMADACSTCSSNNYLIQPTDVTKVDDCEILIQSTLEKFGRIDCLINNAGISMRALFHDTNLEVIHKVMDVNFWGMVNCTHFALPHLRKTKGSVVGISSIAGYRGLPARTGYCASKFAMNGFLEALRTEELKTGIHVLTASPGFTASNIRNVALTNLGSTQGDSPRDEQKMMTAEEVAEHIYKAVEKRKRTLLLTSKGKLTVLLNKFFPKLLDTLVYNHLAKEEDSPFK